MQGPIISVMLAVADTPTAVEWYKGALGAMILWDLGGVAGLEIAGAPFFLGEPHNNGWESPTKLGITSTRVEVFCDDPDTFIARAVEAGADGDFDPVKNHQMPWDLIGRAGSRTHSDTSGWWAIDRHWNDIPASISPVCCWAISGIA